MAKRNAINLSATVNADGFNIAGGTTERTLTLTGGNATITGGGAAVITFPTSTSTLATLALTEVLSNKSFSTAPLPSANDSVALGASGTAFSDIFLAEGAVINWDAGDLTLTQTNNNLALGGGGHFLVGGADGSAWVDIAGATDTVQGLRIEGTTTAAISFSTYVTADAFLRFNFLATGHMTWGGGSGAGDTNLYRQGANVLMTDDELRVTVAGTETTSVVNIAGTQTLVNKKVSHTFEPGSDDTFTGEQITGFNAGATVAQWDCVFLATDGKWDPTDADATASAGAVMVGMAAAASTDTNPLTVITRGVVRNDGWAWATVGVPLYLDTTTPGAMTLTAPSGTDDVVRIVGYVLSDDCIYFNPSNDYITRT